MANNLNSGVASVSRWKWIPSSLRSPSFLGMSDRHNVLLVVLWLPVRGTTSNSPLNLGFPGSLLRARTAPSRDKISRRDCGTTNEQRALRCGGGGSGPFKAAAASKGLVAIYLPARKAVSAWATACGCFRRRSRAWSVARRAGRQNRLLSSSSLCQIGPDVKELHAVV